MDRVTTFFQALVRETDLLQSQENGMAAIGWLAGAALGPTPVNPASGFASAVDGFTCIPSTPATMNVVLTPGQVYQSEPLEASVWSSLPANSTPIVKQGLMQQPDTITIAAPTTIGFSQVYLIEVQYADLDTNPVLLPYFDAANPAVPFSGPANNGQSQNTARLGIAAVQIKAGIPAATGSQVTPTQDAGWIGIFAITVSFGQTTITAGNIVTIQTAPWIPTKLPGVPTGVLNSTWVFCNDTGAANAYAASISLPGFNPNQLVAGMMVRLKVAHTNTGASTFNFNGLGTAPILRANLAAVQASDLTSGQVADLIYDGANWQMVNYLGIGGSPVNNFNSTVGLPYVADSSGTPNVITANFSPVITSGQMVAGLAVAVKLANTTTGATTITVNANTAVAVVFPDGTPIGNQNLKTGSILVLIHDGTRFQVIASVGGGLTNIQAFTSSGTYTPTPGARKVIVIATGGGGAGGCALSCSGGGAAGSTAIAIVDLIANHITTVAVTVGAGGVGVQAVQNGSSAGGAGGQTSFGSFAIAPGGAGGPGSDKPGIGSNATVGTVLIPGGDGMTSYSGPNFGSGNGGPSFWGGGGAGATVAENTGSGHAAQAPGSGGGGGDSGMSGGGRTGGNGAPGIVVVLEF